MPLSGPNSPFYDNNTLYPNAITWGNIVATDSTGLATWYLTDDGTATGNALFKNIFLNSIIITPWNVANGSAIYLQVTPTISADFKKVNCQIRQNSSLLGLGLIPFSSAAAGVMVSLSCRGIQ